MFGQHDQGPDTGQYGGIAVVRTPHVVQQGRGYLGHVVTTGQGTRNLQSQHMTNNHITYTHFS